MRLAFRAIIVGFLAFAPVSTCLSSPPPVSASVSVSGTQHDTDVVFAGITSPNAFITFFDGSSTVGSTSAAADGSFTKTLLSQLPGSHTYSLQATDGDGVTSAPASFLVNLQANAETQVSDIVMPATISQLSGSHPGVHGTAAPGLIITLFISPENTTETTTVAGDGTWSHVIATPLPAGSHDVYAVASTSTGHLSPASSTINFNITCLIADFNCSSRVDMVDFSVMMYYWGSSNPTADLNGDGIIDLTDFSILMYYWTG